MSTKLKLRLLSPLTKVFPGQPIPKGAAWAEPTALRGESVAFQAAVAGPDNLRGWARLHVDAPAWARVTLRRVSHVPGSTPIRFRTDGDYLTKAPGLFPDLLEPMEGPCVPVISGWWHCVWIDVEVPQDAPAGEHALTVRLEDEAGVPACEQRVTLRVVAATLPEQDFPHTEWFHADCLAVHYGVEMLSEEHWAIVERFAECAVRHGANMLLTPIHTPPLDTEQGGERPTVQLIEVREEGGRYTFGFEKLKRWVDMCARIGVRYLEMAHLFTQWGAKHAPKIMGWRNGEYQRLFGWETDATGAEYRAYLQQMLPALTAALASWGVADRTYFHISDEPSCDQLEDYRAARDIAVPLLQGYKVIDALSDYKFYKSGAVPVPIPAVDHIEPFLKGDVPELWCYHCCAQSYRVPNRFFAQSSYRNRILGALLYQHNIAGFLQWGFNFYYCMHSVYPVDPFLSTDADGTFPSGDTFLVYPGKDGHPLGSIRLMVVMHAFNDLRAMKLLESLAGRDFVLGLIGEGRRKPITFTDYPREEGYLLRLRARVNEEIAKRV